jgi:hypothetical protein
MTAADPPATAGDLTGPEPGTRTGSAAPGQAARDGAGPASERQLTIATLNRRICGRPAFARRPAPGGGLQANYDIHQVLADAGLADAAAGLRLCGRESMTGHQEGAPPRWRQQQHSTG